MKPMKLDRNFDDQPLNDVVLNLTQHNGTPEQDVVEPLDKGTVKEMLTFSSLPSHEDILDRASKLAVLASNELMEADNRAAMIGGAPYLMPALVDALKAYGIKPLFAFSERVSEDKHMPDGTVQKVNVFKHIGWIEA